MRDDYQKRRQEAEYLMGQGGWHDDPSMSHVHYEGWSYPRC